MTLYYKGEPIITYDPNNDDPDNQSKKKWWMNAFDPQHQGVNASELTATYTIDFSENAELYEAFIQTVQYDSRWTLDPYTHKATFTF